ncbi:MAG: hypothetical protein H6604_06770 [Flavobacteriales bacterium]|nr:hypothetical protein [Flavobacteriales bacterium]
MKKEFIVFSFLMIVTFVQAQKFNKEELTKIEREVYKNALKYSDIQTAIKSIHSIIALEGENSTYKDTLMYAYTRSQNYFGSHKLAEELLKKRPNDEKLLEVDAVSLKQLGAVKEAIVAYEKLFNKTQNMYYGYELASLQNGIKRLVEAELTIDNALKSEEIKDAYIVFPVDKNNQQKVPLKAALYNLKGIVAFEQKNKDAANIAFQEALKIMPEFALATQNLNTLVVETQNEKSNKEE